MVLFGLGFFFTDSAPTKIYTLSLHDALPIYPYGAELRYPDDAAHRRYVAERSEEHTSELQSLRHLVCRLLLEKKNARARRRRAGAGAEAAGAEAGSYEPARPPPLQRQRGPVR